MKRDRTLALHMPCVYSANRTSNPQLGRRARQPLHYRGFAFDVSKCRIYGLSGINEKKVTGCRCSSDLVSETVPVI